MTTEYKPLVSIVIPVYNGANYLNQAINSALAQTYENIEVLVINDGSNDEGATAAIAKVYGNRIRYFEKENGGVSTALNFGIDHMKGEYFSWLSHDDMYTPDKISAEMSVIQKNGECIVGCNVFVVAQDGTILSENKLSHRKEKSARCFLALDTDTGINGCSLLIPKKGFELCGNFKRSLKCTQDYDMWFRLLDCFPLYFSDVFGVLSRQHEAQDSKTKTVLCTEEADILHSRFLKNISCEEMQSFLSGEDNYLIRQYRIYKNAGYLKTSAQIAKHIWDQENGSKKFNYIISDILPELCGQKELVSKLLTQLRVVDDVVDTKKRIMFYSNVWTKGGIERVLSVLLPEFIDEFRVILVSNFIENELGFALPQDVIHIKVDSELNNGLPYGLLVLALLTKVDIFVGNPNIIYSFLDVYKLMEESGIRTIASNHGYYFIPYWAEWIYPVAEKRKEIYPLVSAVTWLTSFSTYLGRQISDNAILMPNPNTFCNQTYRKNNGQEKNILIVGRFYDEIKRVDIALKVFREVVKAHVDAKLYLVGGYDINMHIPLESDCSIKKLIEDLRFPNYENIIWVGEVDDLKPYYEIASVLMLTSENEGFSLVLNEAGTFGVPQVVFEIPGISDLVQDGVNGYLVPQGDISGMADKIGLLLENHLLFQTMSINAQKLANRYNKEEIVARWKKLFRLLLEENEKECLNVKLKDQFPLDMSLDVDGLKEIVSAYNNQIKKITKYEDKKSCYTEQELQLKREETSEDESAAAYSEYLEAIYQSNSWKITKPLRWISLTVKSLKKNGVIITGRKIKNRFKLKFNKE